MAALQTNSWFRFIRRAEVEQLVKENFQTVR